MKPCPICSAPLTNSAVRCECCGDLPTANAPAEDVPPTLQSGDRSLWWAAWSISAGCVVCAIIVGGILGGPIGGCVAAVAAVIAIRALWDGLH